MSSRLVTTLRAIAGGIVGGVAGAIIVLVIAGAIAAAIGNSGGWALGFVMAMWGTPIAFVAGAALGGSSAAAGRASGIFRFTTIAGIALAGFAIVVAIVLPDNRPKAVVDAKGCTIGPRVGSFAMDGRYVVVYDRFCSGGEGHTVNVSAVHRAGDSIVGPGNVLVLAGELEGVTPSGVETYADVRDSTHVVVRFDHRAHVLGQTSPVEGFEVAFEPTIGLPVAPAPRPEPPEALKAIIRAQEESLAAHVSSTPPPQPFPREDREVLVARRESLMAHRPPRRERTLFPDAERCTIGTRFRYMPYAQTYVVYERICPTEPRRTINLSQVEPTSSVDGPGNILILVNDEPARSDSAAVYVPVSFHTRDSHHIDVTFAPRFHMLMSATPVHGVEFTFRADPDFRPPGPPSPTGGP